jgi:DNA-binding XRE family transcriptional regulator
MDDFKKHLKESLQDPAFKAEYETKELRYKIIDILVGIRVQYKLTQSELAQKLGTTQAVISRIENGSVNVGIDFLQKVAKTFNKKIDISIAA